jgi:predicted Na+-dependent transporter
MIEFLRSIPRSIIRTLSFPRKEIVEILRQPRLVLTLVLGPFLILLLVGVGTALNVRLCALSLLWAKRVP